jgi:hypothetical protein
MQLVHKRSAVQLSKARCVLVQQHIQTAAEMIETRQQGWRNMPTTFWPAFSAF